MAKCVHRIVAVYANGAERINIVRYPDGRFSNRYGVDSLGNAESCAWGMKSLREAKQMLFRHRPCAQRIR